jgi:hypothetical protein
MLQTLTRTEIFLIIYSLALTIERVIHFVKYGQPIKKMNKLQIDYKEAIARTMTSTNTLRERDTHITMLETQLSEERLKSARIEGLSVAKNDVKTATIQ